MTRISGMRVIETPCCKTQYSTPAYGSINLTSHEFWTDGRRVGSLFGGDATTSKPFLKHPTNPLPQRAGKRPRAIGGAVFGANLPWVTTC